MTFLHPGILLAGLLAVSIPIAIHFLMRRRRKPIPWAAMRFLMEAYRKKRRRLRLEQLLLLAARCLLLALAGLALARPMLGAGTLGSTPRVLVVLIDNSLTARLADAKGESALSRHLALAERAIAALDPARGDRAAVIALSAPASAVVAQPSADLGSVARALGDIAPTDARADIAGGAALARSIFESSAEGEAVVLIASDLLAGSAAIESELPALVEGGRTVRVLAPDPAAGRANTAIVGIDPSRRVVAPDEPAGRLIVARLARSGAGTLGEARSTVRVTDERLGRVLGEAIAVWEPGQRERTVSVPIAGDALAGSAGGAPGAAGADGGIANGSVCVLARIEGDDLGGDDARRSVLELRSIVRVGLVARSAGSATGIGRYAPGDWVRLALQPEAGQGAIDLVPIEPVRVDGPTLARLDAAIVLAPDDLSDAAWAALAVFADAGGLIVLTPPADAQSHLWADALGGRLGVGWSVEAQDARPAEGAGINAASVDRLGLLGLIDAELAYLAPPVGVARWVRLSPATAGQTLDGVELRLSDGSPWITSARPGDGRGLVVLIASAIDPEWTDLPAKPLVVPLMQEIVRQGVGRARTGTAVEAGARAVAPAGAVELIDALSEARSGAVALDESGRTVEPVRLAGAFNALDAGGSSRGMLVVNASAAASDTSPRTREELGAWLGGLSPDAGVEWLVPGESGPGGADGGHPRVEASLGGGDEGWPIAWMVLLGVLALALLELGLARLSSHVSSAGSEA